MLLLDTHVLHWLALGDNQLGRNARKRIEDAAPETLHVSVVSLWEIGTLMRNKRLRPPLALDLVTLQTGWASRGCPVLSLTLDVVMAADRLADFHEDPADRFLAASAMTHGLAIVTADRKILEWTGALKKIDARR